MLQKYTLDRHLSYLRWIVEERLLIESDLILTVTSFKNYNDDISDLIGRNSLIHLQVHSLVRSFYSSFINVNPIKQKINL